MTLWVDSLDDVDLSSVVLDSTGQILHSTSSLDDTTLKFGLRALSLDNGDVFISWLHVQGSEHGVYALVCNSNGVVTVPTFRLDGSRGINRLDDLFKLSTGEVVLLWADPISGTGTNQVVMSLYEPTTNTLLDPVTINTDPKIASFNSRAVLMAGDKIFIVWMSYPDSGISFRGIEIQIDLTASKNSGRTIFTTILPEFHISDMIGTNLDDYQVSGVGNLNVLISYTLLKTSKSLMFIGQF